MAILHLDVDVGRRTQSTMVKVQAEMLTQLQQMNAEVNNFKPGWIGNAANQFFQEYEQLSSATNKILEEINNMNTRLSKEIDEWEQTGATY